ncbi:pirin family protein [Tumebacillus sp. ITR2]|uniref:Pirin family protein n=1 Tax=Tumebacillus amylolyticus TaxID=2801339 RepID=A0ABS1JDG1_9BACL|nr:pirin family protein [Tumebacillus amylolyticus]MBL0388327.1 pirin family protein [Tumebacillus amylolyticus]
MAMNLYTPDQQAVGYFDGGKIVEQKPIGFPGEGSAVKRVGPLFYWAWFSAKEFGEIPMHPHKGFEIVTYFMTGVGGHKDSLGTVSTVKGGGAQVMQTGSGAYHAETMDADTDGFQIWFEPFTGDAVKRKPTYAQFEHEEFPAVVENGATVKSVVGGESPVQLVADAQMWDVTLEAGATFSKDVPAGYSLTALVVEGNTEWTDGKKDTTRVPHRVFAVYGAEVAEQVTVTAADNQPARVIFILVPSVLAYPDYRHVREFYA